MFSTMQDAPLTVSRILRHGVRVHGSSSVITWTGSGAARRRSFAEVGARAAQLAHALRELGVGEGDVTGTLMWNNSEHVEAYFAVPSMGAVLHTLNLRLPADQLSYIARHAGDKVILVNGSLVGLLLPILPNLPRLEHVVVSGAVADDARAALAAATGVHVHEYEELLAGHPTAYDWPELDERRAASLCYTSGTTGEPKGVAYSHRSIYLHSMQVNMAESMGLTDADLSLVIVPQFHCNSWGLPHAAFMTGVNMLMPDRFLQPGPIAEMIERERPTHAAAVPTIWQGLLAELTAKPRDVSTLTQVTIGGSACPPALMKAFDDIGMRVFHAWGMTETSPLGTVARPPAKVAPGSEEEFAYRLTQGRFPAGVEGRLIGPGGEELPWDGASAGELEVRGPWIAGAYFGGIEGEATRPADKFSEDGWLKTGDVGTISADGYLTLTDRAKDVIKSGGEWISSVELENVLMSHPDVAEAAVVAVPDEKWGERPLATVVLREGAAADWSALREHLASNGIARWQLPERWALVAEVPKTSVGKFDKKVLRGRYADGELQVARV
ncbi:long-chain fatty acid--CoA ligase [Streptomyces sp. H27-H5]|uniref:long-chain fatty acid--CoA ligase n=1 Tax=Streptomyces sp. H27-H5 TaxID=2996460 RepID=UPI002270B81C|nr:long-chain fatty acid--CoA ligase [Streptomyces sp. H27-H5]MCY0959585.1 long-chain fatty acid--CoA ligase [Streptomyces sp. H27-H5]